MGILSACIVVMYVIELTIFRNLFEHDPNADRLFQELTWQITQNLDFEGNKRNLFTRSPFLELSCVEPQTLDEPPEDASAEDKKRVQMMNDSVQFAHEMPSPRVIKTHVPLEMLPPNLLDVAKGKKEKTQLSPFHLHFLFSSVRLSQPKGLLRVFLPPHLPLQGHLRIHGDVRAVRGTLHEGRSRVRGLLQPPQSKKTALISCSV